MTKAGLDAPDAPGWWAFEGSGFVSPKYRWNHALYGIDTVVGKWWRIHLPWDEEETNVR